MSLFSLKLIAICGAIGGCLVYPISKLSNSLLSKGQAGEWIELGQKLEEMKGIASKWNGMDISQNDNCLAWNRGWAYSNLTLLLKCQGYYHLYIDRSLSNSPEDAIKKAGEIISREDSEAKSRLEKEGETFLKHTFF